MTKYLIPEFFRQLQTKECLQERDILNSGDGFYLAYKSLADILAEKDIFDFLDSENRRLLCSNFFDDWFLYAVPEDGGYVYSLLKLREQEHDLESGAPADGDTPGVTVSFISFDREVLLNCLTDPLDANRQKLNAEINRVVAYRGQHHHSALKRYFVNPAAEGAYLVADLYPRHIAAFSENGSLAVPDGYKEILRKSASPRYAAKYGRIPRFIEEINKQAGRVVCDDERIYIKDREHPDAYESAAILATHTANTSVYSFAAEVEYHARFLTPFAKIRIPFVGKSIYESAIRADMTIGDTEFEGPAPFYRTDSKLVMRQYHCHKDKIGKRYTERHV